MELTIKTTDVQHVFTATIVDSEGAPVSGVSGYIFGWSANDNGSLVNVFPGGASVTIKPTGAAGSLVLSCTAGKPGSPAISGSMPITIAGQTPDHLQIVMQS